MRDEPVYESELAVYGDAPPFVREVRWEHPSIRDAMRGLAPGWRSIYAYPEWRVPFGLEDEALTSETALRDARVRNFIRVLLGEYRDHPAMLRARLACLARQVTAGPGELAAVDAGALAVSQLTHPAYARLVALMRVSHELREALQASPRDGFNYNFRDDAHPSSRKERSVAPWTDRELSFALSRYLVGGAPRVSNEDAPLPPDTVAGWRFELERRAAMAAPGDDLGWMYTFRGHSLITPLWLESNAFIWNARRAGRAWRNRGVTDYYLRPFRARYERSRAAWGAWLFHRDDDDHALRRASEEGGGPVLYLTDHHETATGLAAYKLFAEHAGAGEDTAMAPDPTVNGNMVPWALAAATAPTTEPMRGWRRELMARPDMGFLELFNTFEARMARLCQCIDRHTNWGPTGYYMADASREGARPDEVEFLGAYSPLVATSHDVSASHEFAVRAQGSSFEAGHPRWLHVVRFPSERLYDEEALRAGRPIDFDRDWFPESSLSNDYYCERGLTRFGSVLDDELCANIYLVHGARGEEPPPPVDIPPP
ncbi:MAG: hypothetical protein U0326_33575 [Polyangiales bacterium]